ncbi:MAG: excinuclease ABC subunit UvrA [Chitinophagaceae bacterium]
MGKISTASKKTKQAALFPDIVVKGARVHNLKNITVTFPRNRFIVVTGVSGSGKSSLTIDTLYAEGQRRYAESLSAYARQFLNRMNKPDVDYIHGLCPAIAIEQKVITRTPRSTVGSMTEIYDYLRLLFARVGKTISPVSGKVVKKQDVGDVMEAVRNTPTGTRMLLLVAFKQSAKRERKEELSILLQKGFTRIYEKAKRKPGRLVQIEDLLSDEEKVSCDLYVLVDRFVAREMEEEAWHRIADSIHTAFYEGEGELFLEADGDTMHHFSNRFEADGMRFEEPVPNLFSFNNPFGACPVCEGFSQVLGIDEDLVIPDKSLSVYEGAVAPWKGEKLGWWREQFVKQGTKSGFPVHKAIADLNVKEYKQLWTGIGNALGIDAFFNEVEQNLYKVQYRVLLSRYRGRTTCTACEGYRLRKEALYVKVNGKHIGELCNMPVADLKAWFDALVLSEFDQQVAKRILSEIHNRLNTLLHVGLGYLTLSRLANTLSGGESQRIQLTRSLGSNLTNSLYILDEPSIGLHPRDTANLITVLKHLRDLGNTIVVVEHDEMMMQEADHIIDMGPLASHLGGEVVAAGSYEEIIHNPESLTGKYLNGTLSVVDFGKPRSFTRSIILEGCRQNNLRNIDVEFPLNVLCVVTGVSGSGKTTLVRQILHPALQRLRGDFSQRPGTHKALRGDVDAIAQVELIDQNPIGKSSRSNPVTYIKAYDEIRELFSKQQLSKIRGYLPKHFSFNVDGGRCDACKGEGEQLVEMQFLADVHLTCEVCGGKRFKEEVLEVQYQGKSIYDVLCMSVDEAIDFFQSEKDLVNKLRPLQAVGLGYVQLGQSSDTLSGGEAQRVKLASFLGRGTAQGQILFIFDEPTTGLHFHDITKLLKSFHALVEKGHSVLVIEHNTDVIRRADWVIDLGPEAGAGGGQLVFAGTPARLAKASKSITGRYLSK